MNPIWDVEKEGSNRAPTILTLLAFARILLYLCLREEEGTRERPFFRAFSAVLIVKNSLGLVFSTFGLVKNSPGLRSPKLALRFSKPADALQKVKCVKAKCRCGGDEMPIQTGGTLFAASAIKHQRAYLPFGARV